MRWSAEPIRSNWSTCHPRPCAVAWPTATSTRRSASTPRSATTSVPGTSAPFASSPCSGSPIGWRTRFTTTSSATASPMPGRPASASSWPSPALPEARRSSGAHLACRPAAEEISSACGWCRRTDSRSLRGRTSMPSASCSKSSAALTTRWSAATFPLRCSPSHGARRRRRSCSARAADRSASTSPAAPW